MRNFPRQLHLALVAALSTFLVISYSHPFPTIFRWAVVGSLAVFGVWFILDLVMMVIYTFAVAGVCHTSFTLEFWFYYWNSNRSMHDTVVICNKRIKEAEQLEKIEKWVREFATKYPERCPGVMDLLGAGKVAEAHVIADAARAKLIREDKKAEIIWQKARLMGVTAKDFDEKFIKEGLEAVRVWVEDLESRRHLQRRLDNLSLAPVEGVPTAKLAKVTEAVEPLIKSARQLGCEDDVRKLILEGHMATARELIANTTQRRTREHMFADLEERISALPAAWRGILPDQLAQLRTLDSNDRNFRKVLHDLKKNLIRAEELKRTARHR